MSWVRIEPVTIPFPAVRFWLPVWDEDMQDDIGELSKLIEFAKDAEGAERVPRLNDLMAKAYSIIIAERPEMVGGRVMAMHYDVARHALEISYFHPTLDGVGFYEELPAVYLSKKLSQSAEQNQQERAPKSDNASKEENDVSSVEVAQRADHSGSSQAGDSRNDHADGS